MPAFRTTHIKALRTLVSLVLIPAALGACKEKRTVWPAFNALTNETDFVFGTVGGPEQVMPIEFLEVVTCNTDSTQAPTDSAIWRIEAATKPPILKSSRVTYGETPEGARVAVEAQPLVPGCYWVRDSKARYRFQRHPSGLSGFGDLLATDPVFKQKQ